MTPTIDTTRLSERARVFLAEVGYERPGPIAPVDEIRRRFGGVVEQALLDRLIDFEQRYGAMVIAPQSTNLEMGIGRLLSHGIEPEVMTDRAMVLVGTEEHSDIYVDARGWLWWSGPDRVLGELATSVEKYVERLASYAFRPWADESFVLHCSPMLLEMTQTLGLTRDEIASDDTYVLAYSERHVLQAKMLGTAWQTGWHTLYCRDFDAVIEAIMACREGACSLSGAHSSILSERLDVAQAPPIATVEARLAALSLRRVPTLEDGALHVMSEGHIEAYGVLAEGSLRYELTLGREGGHYREFFVPWI